MLWRNLLAQSAVSGRQILRNGEAASFREKVDVPLYCSGVTATMRFVSIAARWVLRGSWAWITLKPGSRPRRTARKLVGAAVRFVLARPLLARIWGLATTPSTRCTLRSERERFVHARLQGSPRKKTELMRLVIDLQGAQTESHKRGIGRYSLAVALAIARHRGDHEILLALNGRFPDRIEPIRASFDGLCRKTRFGSSTSPAPYGRTIRTIGRGSVKRN